MGNAYPFIVGLKWLVAVRERERESVRAQKLKSWTELKPTLVGAAAH